MRKPVDRTSLDWQCCFFASEFLILWGFSEARALRQLQRSGYDARLRRDAFAAAAAKQPRQAVTPA